MSRNRHRHGRDRSNRGIVARTLCITVRRFYIRAIDCSKFPRYLQQIPSIESPSDEGTCHGPDRHMGRTCAPLSASAFAGLRLAAGALGLVVAPLVLALVAVAVVFFAVAALVAVTVVALVAVAVVTAVVVVILARRGRGAAAVVARLVARLVTVTVTGAGLVALVAAVPPAVALTLVLPVSPLVATRRAGGAAAGAGRAATRRRARAVVVAAVTAVAGVSSLQILSLARGTLTPRDARQPRAGAWPTAQ